MSFDLMGINRYQNGSACVNRILPVLLSSENELESDGAVLLHVLQYLHMFVHSLYDCLLLLHLTYTALIKHEHRYRLQQAPYCMEFHTALIQHENQYRLQHIVPWVILNIYNLIDVRLYCCLIMTQISKHNKLVEPEPSVPYQASYNMQLHIIWVLLLLVVPLLPKYLIQDAA